MSLLIHMLDSGKLDHKRILAIDQTRKTSNDRTWCFWEQDSGMFESIVCKSWDKLWFHSKNYSRLLRISPYRYKMIRGIDFYNYCMQRVLAAKNVSVVFGSITEIFSEGDNARVKVDEQVFQAAFVFSSIQPEQRSQSGCHYLLQHFMGWIVEMESDVFDPEHATLMDFQVSQKPGSTFVYQMPFSPRKALIEYTLFSKSLLESWEYEFALREYMNRRFGSVGYQIVEKEWGVIPMTNYQFPRQNKNIFFIGTAGGRTKPSSGYTFHFIQCQSAAIVTDLLMKGRPIDHQPKKKFNFYDSVLLNVLSEGKLQGEEIFTDLFKKNSVQNVFAFLDNESSLKQDFKIISSLPWKPFLRAGMQEIQAGFV